MFLNKSKYWLIAWSGSIICYIALSMHLPVTLFTTAGHDDALFIKNAQHIISGDWLGSYNQMTLAKGPAYSVFIALNAFLGIPLTLAVALFYLMSCALLVRAFSIIGLNGALGFLLFNILIFQPAIFPTRIVRENIYVSLTLLVISGLIYLTEQEKCKKLMMTKNIFFGLALGVFWITREEGIWIFPAVLFYLLILFFVNFNNQKKLWNIIRRFVVYIIAASIIPIVASLINFMAYGKLEVVDFTGHDFKVALDKLNSVYIESEIPHVPVPYSKRTLLYKASPAFRELESYFEGSGRGWQGPGCEAYKHSCGDYAGGWFMWALRDAVAERGYYSSPQAAADFYNQISMEIDSACKSGELKCRSKLIPFIPNIPSESFQKIPLTFYKAILLSAYNTPVEMALGSSTGTSDNIEKIKEFLGGIKIVPLSGGGPIIKIDGWFYSPNRNWIGIHCNSDRVEVLREIERIYSPDISKNFNDKNANYQRFSISAANNDDCEIYIKNNNSDRIKSIKLVNLKVSGNQFGGDLLYIDNKSVGEMPFSTSLYWKSKIEKFYKLVSPIIGILGFLSFLIAIGICMSKKIIPSLLFMIVSVLWILYLVRILLVVLIDISSFPAINYLYLSPILPIFSAASISSIALLYIQIKQLRDYYYQSPLPLNKQ
jgi:hypothetical protein